MKDFLTKQNLANVLDPIENIDQVQLRKTTTIFSGRHNENGGWEEFSFGNFSGKVWDQEQISSNVKYPLSSSIVGVRHWQVPRSLCQLVTFISFIYK